MSAEKSVLLQAAPTTEYPNGYPVTIELLKLSVALNDQYEAFGGAVDAIPLDGGQDNNSIANVFNYVKSNYDRVVKSKDGVPEGADRNEPLSPENKIFFDTLISTSMKPIFDFILAANYMDIKVPLHDACKYIAHYLIKGKSPEEIRKTFSVEVPAEIKA
jgi:hypothetical protein